MPSLGALVRKRRVRIHSSTSLDGYFHMGHGRRLEVLGAPGTGKTALALAFAASTLKSGGKVSWISDRAFPLERLKQLDSTLDVSGLVCYNLTLQQLLLMKPLHSDLVVVEHYEYLLNSETRDWRDMCAAIGASLDKWPGAVMCTSTPCRVKAELAAFGGGLPLFNRLLLWHSRKSVDARIGTTTLKGLFSGEPLGHGLGQGQSIGSGSSEAGDAPDLVHFLSDPPESPWGLASTPKRRWIMTQGSLEEAHQAFESVKTRRLLEFEHNTT